MLHQEKNLCLAQLEKTGINRSMSKLIINTLSFQLGWWLCVLYGDAAAPWVVLGVVFVHHRLVGNMIIQWPFMLALTSVGVLFDSVLNGLGVLVFPEGALFPPMWLIAIWVLFSTTLLYALVPLVRYRMGFSLVCGLAGPASYLAGSQFADVKLGIPLTSSLLWLSLAWMIMGLMISEALRRVRLI